MNNVETDTAPASAPLEQRAKDFGMPVHEACALFPLMDSGALAQLTASIKVNGLEHPVVIHEGQIVDGRNRILACKAAGVEPTYKEWSQVRNGHKSLTQWIWDENANRRHLSKQEMAYAVVAMKDIEEKEDARQRQNSAGSHGKEGGRGHKKTLGVTSTLRVSAKAESGRTRVRLAKASGASVNQVRRAMAVKKRAPALFHKVVRREITPDEAESQVGIRDRKQNTHETGVLAGHPPSAAATGGPSHVIDPAKVLDNIKRHTKGQRAIAGALVLPIIREESKLARQYKRTSPSAILAKVSDGDLRENEGPTSVAAKLFRVGTCTIEHAVRVLENDLEAAAKVARREIQLETAYREVRARVPSKRQMLLDKAATRKLVEGLSQIAGLCKGLEEIDVNGVWANCTPEEIKTWARMAGDAAKLLRAFGHSLQHREENTNEAHIENEGGLDSGTRTPGAPDGTTGSGTGETEAPDTDDGSGFSRHSARG